MHPLPSTPDVKSLAVAVVSRVKAFGQLPNKQLDPTNCKRPAGWTDRQWYDLRLVREQLMDEGFEYLGAGAFSVAYTHRDYPGRVLKINLRPDQASVDWWQHCLYNPGRGIPEVYATGYLGRVDGDRIPFVWMKKYSAGCDLTRGRVCAWWDARSQLLPSWAPDGITPEFVNELAYIRNVMDQASCYGRDDLHSDNIMWCEDTHSWVVTDPVYEG